MLSPNQPRQDVPQKNTLCIWVFHDERAGHLSQLEGLVKRLAFHHDCDVHWFNVHHHPLGLKDLFVSSGFLTEQTKPDVILGAGHSTHKNVLISGFKHKAFTTLIMKPSMPVCLFNAVICPRHDKLKESQTVLNTFGPINKIDKNLSLRSAKEKDLHLILIGGVSKHYDVDIEHILQQIKTICLESPQTQWVLSNSPRTPQALNEQLNTLNLTNLCVQDYKHNNLVPLQDLLISAKQTWITPDSMSMIFEALTAQSHVSLFNCKAKKNTRIVKQVVELIEQGYVNTPENTCTDKTNHHAIAPLTAKTFPWEADRAAQWLLKQFSHRQSLKSKVKHLYDDA